MAKANLTQPIPPFPTDIDRTAFGHWLSGFTDGEGCFALGRSERMHNGARYVVPAACFSIGLRADDGPVLQLVHSFFQCGALVFFSRTNHGNPMYVFRSRKISDLANIISPHFVAHPLFAKKSRDFTIWKQAVDLMSEVISRPYTRRPSGRGMAPKWTTQERAQFEQLCAELRDQRTFTPLPST